MSDQGFLSRRTILGGLGGLAALPLAATRSRAATPIKIGYTTDTEQSILGNFAALVLEKKLNLPVQRVANLGGTGVAHQAIIDGAIDIYPDYTGDALANVLKMNPITNPSAAWAAVHDAYLSKYQITWLKPTPFNNTYALAVKKEIAASKNIKTISDLAPYAAHWTLGCSVEFAGRPLDGYLGMAKHYGFRFGHLKPMDVGLMYTAIDSGKVDVIVAYATDARIGKVGLTVLEDDKMFFPSYNAAFTVRNSILAAHPEIAPALDAVTATLTTETEIGLNGQSDIGGIAPEKVAEAYLKAHNLI